MWEREIEKAVALLSQASYAIALTGAGSSTESGLPDFRSPDTGLWRDFNPEEVASIQAFKSNPTRFYEFYTQRLSALFEAKPNKVHYALAELEKMGIIKRVITQNIDGLHQRAGSKRVIEVHGNLQSASCMKCGRRITIDELLTILEEKPVPFCKCGGIYKPDVILFGEMLPEEAIAEAFDMAVLCNLMLVIGSSLQVSPVNSLPDMALRYSAKLIIINREPTYIDHQADVVIRDTAGEIMSEILRRIKDGEEVQ